LNQNPRNRGVLLSSSPLGQHPVQAGKQLVVTETGTVPPSLLVGIPDFIALIVLVLDDDDVDAATFETTGVIRDAHPSSPLLIR
jgi:hypothetical protein